MRDRGKCEAVGVQPRSVIYAITPGMTPGLGALMRQLSERGASGPSDVLGPVTALKELETVCNDVASGREAPHKPNRVSLMEDIQMSLSALGPCVKAQAEHLLKDFRSLVGKLPASMEAPGDVAVFRLTTGSVLAQLGSDEVVGAAWRDTVAMFRQTNSPSSECELRIMQLVDLAEHRGVDYQAWAKRAELILRDDPRLLAVLGEISEQEASDGRKLAGVDEQRRIDLCEEALAQLPERSQVVVWLALADAAMPDEYISTGPIQIFSAATWPDAILTGKVSTETGEAVPAPRELADGEFVDRLTQASKNVRETAGCALVRVTLEDSTPPVALERAQGVIRGLIDIGKAERSTWRLLDGQMTWTPNDWAGRGFSDPEADELRRQHLLRRDRTHLNFQQFDDEFVTRWLSGELAAQRAVDDAIWVSTIKRTQSLGQRVILAVRAVEHVVGHLSSNKQEGWVAAARRYLRSVMVHHQLLNELQDALYCAVNAMERTPGVTVDSQNKLWQKAFPPSGGEGYLLTDLAHDLVDELPNVISFLAEGSMERRILSETVRLLQDPGTALNRLAGYGQMVDRMLARTSRQRNAVVHGTGVTESLLNNVDAFAIRLADYASDQPLLRAQDGRDPLADLEQDRVMYADRERRLKAGEVPVEVFWT
jgi:hypothetical protein